MSERWRQWAVGIALGAGLVTLALVLRGRDRLPDTPEDAVSAFFDAQQQGDDRAYLRLTCDELRRSLEQTREQAGAEAFRQSLVRSSEGIKGLAVSQSGNASGEAVALDVEIVFADRNERQRMVLARQETGWAIASIERAEMEKPPIRYGTPVFEEPVKEAKPPK